VNISLGDVWMCKFPLEEDPSTFLPRPVIVLAIESLDVLSAKVTKHAPRDNHDIPIVKWVYAGLNFPSTARVSKTIMIDKSQFIYRLGFLHSDDLNEIQTAYMEFVLSQA